MAMLDGLDSVQNRDFSTPVHHISIDDSCMYKPHQVNDNNESKNIKGCINGGLSLA